MKISNIETELLLSNNIQRSKLYFYIKLCLCAQYVNDKSFKNNALFLKEKYDCLYEGFATCPLEFTLNSFDIKTNIKKFPGFTIKNDRIYNFIISEINNENDKIKDILFNPKILDKIDEIINKTKTNI
jgi:hypothetical protein